MPLLHISLRAGKPEAYRQAIFDSLYRAMRETLDVPEDDQFMTITEHDAANFRYGAAFGVARSDDLVYIQITVFDTRTVEQKKALFRRIAELLGESREGELVRRQRPRAICLRRFCSAGPQRTLPGRSTTRCGRLERGVSLHVARKPS